MIGKILICAALVHVGSSCISIDPNACTKGKLMIENDQMSIGDINCDIVIPKKTYTTAPAVKFPEAKKDERYLLVMVDPDAPGHGNGTYFLHWMVSDISGQDLLSGKLNGVELMQYRPPGPPQGTGLHRYMFYVFLYEDKNASLKTKLEENRRRQFNLEEWIKSVKEVKLCGPAASIQYRAGFDDPAKN